MVSRRVVLARRSLLYGPDENLAQSGANGLNLLDRIPSWFAILVLLAAGLYFTARGPWRALGSVNCYDFASVYGAARCWLHGENPYDMRLVNAQVHAAGDTPAIFPNTDPPPSVYLPTAFPLLAPFALLPWKAARLAWCLLSIGAFVFSALLLIRDCGVTGSAKWLLTAGILFFSPTSSGLSTGNPSVLSCSLTIAAILLALRGRLFSPAVLLGLAHSVKPQVSIAALAVLILWRYRRVVLFSFAIPLAVALASICTASGVDQYKRWLLTLRDGIAAISLPGGVNDPSPANYFSYHLVNAAAIASIPIHNPEVVSAFVWTAALALIALYLWKRPPTSTPEITWRDAAFFCTVFLIPVYHRYYDCQLLLGILPWLCRVETRRNAAKWAVWAVLFVLLFPLQAILAEARHGLSPASVAGFVLLRHQPVVILLLTILLVPWARGGGWTFARD
jgi:hypothetical protein